MLITRRKMYTSRCLIGYYGVMSVFGCVTQTQNHVFVRTPKNKSARATLCRMNHHFEQWRYKYVD